MKNQDASNISGSATVNQAQGDIHIYQGMSKEQVRSLCRSVVSAELESYKEQAETIAVQRFDDCMVKFEERLQTLETEVRERLKEPSVQYALHTGLVECVKTTEEDKQEEILDLLIDRLKFDDNESKRYLTDQAIKTLPLLSRQQISILFLKYLFNWFKASFYKENLLGIKFRTGEISLDLFLFLSYVKSNIKSCPFLYEHILIFESADTYDVFFLDNVGCSTSTESRETDHIKNPHSRENTNHPHGFIPYDYKSFQENYYNLLSSFRLTILGDFIAKRLFNKIEDKVIELTNILFNKMRK